MDNFEQLIKNTATSDYKPFEGHEQRFQKKLERRTKVRRLNFYRNIAAVAIALLSVGFFTFNQLGIGDKVQITEEYAEIQHFYTAAINSSIGQIKLLNKNNVHNQEIKRLTKELETYNSELKELNEAIRQAPNDERVINAMVVFYKSRLQTFEQILVELETMQAKQ